jgi:hypothetical protein
LLKVRPHTQYFQLFKYVTDLASGDVRQTTRSVKEAIYPRKQATDKLFTVEELPFKIVRPSTRLWSKLKTGT